MTLKNIFWGLLIGAIALAGCDEIATPLVQKQNTNSTLPNTPPDFKDSSATSGPYKYTQYKLLLEDCMGQRCSNCPIAVAIADSLISPTGDASHYGQVVMMEENFGPFAIPNSNVPGYPSYAFSTDYQCEAGNSWETEFNFGGSTPYPVGMINRLGYSASSPNYDILYPNWQDSVTSILLSPTQTVAINIHDSCWVSQRIIGVEFQVNFLQAQPAGNTYYLEPVICEDHVISWQEDDLLTPAYDSTYDHRFVLRGSFDLIGVGTPIPATNSSTANNTWTSYQTYDFVKGEDGKAGGTPASGAAWNMANCYILAFVYDGTNGSPTQNEVIQAEMIKIE